MTPDEQRFWDACCVPGTGMDLIPEVEAELSARLADAKLAERRKRTVGAEFNDEPTPAPDDLIDVVHALVDERADRRHLQRARDKWHACAYDELACWRAWAVAATGRHHDCDDTGLRRAVSDRGLADTWQPIETAPKDGTPIEYRGEGVTLFDEGKWRDIALFVPTHWRPLQEVTG